MMRRFLSVLLLLCALLPLAACTPASETGDAYLTFTDSTGAEISLSKTPVRVAVLFSSFAELWQLAGGEVAVTVGESIERGFCPEGTPLVDAGAGKTVDAEALIAQKPELVIGSADIAAHVRLASSLKESGIPVALFRVEDFEDYLAVLSTMTDITKNADAYQKNGEEVRLRVEALLQAPRPETAPRILLIRSGSSSSSTKAKTSTDHFAAGMLSKLGCINIADGMPELADTLSTEAILREAPEHIFISLMGDEAAARAHMEALLASEPWCRLEAVKEGNVHFLPRDYFQFKPNARWDAAYALLTEILYE